MDQFLYFYLEAGQSGGGALISYLFIGLQGKLDVARPLGLLLGINLQGQKVRCQHDRGEKGHTNSVKVSAEQKKKSTVEVQVLIPLVPD